MANVAEDGLGDKGNGLAGGDLGAEVAGGDVEGGAGAEVGEEFFGPGGGEEDGGGVGTEAGAGEGYDADEGEQLQGFVPGVQFEEGVGADDEGEFGAGVEGAEGADGVEGVGFAGAVELEGLDGEARFAGDGEAEHGEAVGVGGEVAGGFVGGQGAGDEPDGVEREEAQGFAGDGEVPFVDGIEGSAEEADGAGRGGCGIGGAGHQGERGAIWETTTTGNLLRTTQYCWPRRETRLPARLRRRTGSPWTRQRVFGKRPSVEMSL